MSTPEVVMFHVRGLRYQQEFRSDGGDIEDGFETLDDALGFIEYRNDDGSSCCHEIWIGDERIYDADQALELMLARHRRGSVIEWGGE